MTEVTREKDRGTVVSFFDTRGQRYDALVTEVFGPQCLNLVYVNDVEGQRDNYGQKLIRANSVMHGSLQQAHGYFWLAIGEDRPEHTQPGYWNPPTPEAKEADSSLA